MYDVYWFLDSVPTKDLGLTETGVKSGEDYYVIGGIGGDLASIIGAYDNLGLNKTSTGRKFIKNPENLRLANTVLNDLIDSKKIFVLGTVFYHSQIPPIIRQRPHLYVSSDNPIEVGINGMRGRSFAQTIWIFMESVKENPNINPIVCLDNEDPIIQQSVRHHFKNQLAKLTPEAEVKVQSINKARENEPKGYIVADTICSILREYIRFPDRYGNLKDLIEKTIKFDSMLRGQFDGTKFNGIFETNLVQQWTLGAELRL